MSDTGGQRHRVFFALWPDAAVRAALERHAHALRSGGRRVPRSHLHMTLAFAGTVSAEQYARLCDEAAGVQGRAFGLQLDWLDYFARARVQWLGPTTTPSSLMTLAESLAEACSRAGVTLRDAPFRPHVTLQRHVVEPVRAAVAPAVFWCVRDFVLVESGRDGRPGAYRVVARWPLDNDPTAGR